jgi:hypothetical protein
MELSVIIRPMTQLAIVEHARSIELMKQNEVHLYIECILPQLTRQVFEETMRSVTKSVTLVFNNANSKATSEATLYWRHPVIAGIGPGFFQLKSLDITTALNGNIDTSVQDKVRIYLRERGWKCWWTIDSFCFQDCQDFDIVERGMKLFACYRNEGAGDALLSE